jgi:hypothetical protein
MGQKLVEAIGHELNSLAAASSESWGVLASGDSGIGKGKPNAGG